MEDLTAESSFRGPTSSVNSMSSESATTTRGVSHRTEESAGPAQNATASGNLPIHPPNPAAPPSPSDSKRSNAAQLARELGSSSPWSETLLPQRYGTTSPSINTSTGPTLVESRGPAHIDHNTSHLEQDLDPPPAYSRAAPNNTYQMPDSSTQAADTQTDTLPVANDAEVSQPLLPTDGEQGQGIQQADPDIETPLLVQPSSTHGGRRRSRWTQRRKVKRQRVRRFLCAVFFFCLVASVFVGFLVGHHQGASWFRHPSTKYRQPFVDTGPIYERHETTEDIYGAYKLWDRLVLTTTTGAIDIEIDPQPGDDPAVLCLSSSVGSVTVRIADAYLRRRNKARRTIHTEIHSFTGTICADLILGYGGYASVETTTGSQTINVLASGVGPEDAISNLKTTSGTGTQQVILTSLDSDHTSVSNIRGVHESFGTASLDIIYSPAWVGKVHAVTTPFGQVTVTGDDLKFTEKHADEIVAYRGSGNLTLTEVISKGTGHASFRSSKRDGEDARSVL